MPPTPPLLRLDSNGLFCESGGFYIDPWQPVERALVTHGHADHARRGCGAYLAAAPGVPILKRRLGPEAVIQGIPYGERLRLGDITASFHPSGHILGAAQILLECGDGRWLAAGDYKRQADPTCEAFEPVPCDTFITEATFGLPIFRWGDTATEAREILAWWEENRAAGRASVLFCYALGKAQRVLAELAVYTDRLVYVHGAVEPWPSATGRRGSGCCRPDGSPRPCAVIPLPESWCWRPLRRRPQPGCAASAMLPPVSPRAGCAFAAPVAGAVTTVGS